MNADGNENGLKLFYNHRFLRHYCHAYQNIHFSNVVLIRSGSYLKVGRYFFASFQLPILFHFMTETPFGFDCIGAAQLIWGRRLNSVFLSQMRHLFEGGAYSSKYGILP